MGRASTHRTPDCARRPRSLVVRRPAKDLERPIDLLEDDHAREAVWKGEWRKAPDELRLVADALREAFVAADAKGERLRGIAQLAQSVRELRGGEQRPALVECPELAAHFREQRLRFALRLGGFQLEEIQIRGAADPVRVVLRKLR